MPIALPLERGERVVAQVEYSAHQKAEPFAMAITNRSVFLLQKKFVAVRDPYFLHRVALEEMRGVHVKPLRAAGWYVVAALLVIAGAYTTYAMLISLYNDSGATRSIWPIAVLGVGLILPFAARGRYSIVLEWRDGAFTWKPPFVVGLAARRRREHIISTIIEGARTVGIVVRDERYSA